MFEKVEAYFVMLEQLPSEDLDRVARKIAAHEKHDAARFVAHIAEIAARNYHVALGYANLFQYCVERFNLSEGSVYRRTQVARVCRRFPQILAAISEGRLHLTGASLIAPHLTEKNVEELIAMAAGATKRDLEKRLVALAPKKPFVPSLRKQAADEPAVAAPPVGASERTAARSGAPVRGAAPPAMLDAHPAFAAPSVYGAPTEIGTAEMAATEATSPPAAGGRGPADLLEPVTPDRYNFRFSAGSEFTAKFLRLAEVLGIAYPRNHIEDVLSRALEIALEKKDPQRALERRRQRQARKEAPRPGKEEESQNACPVEGADSPGHGPEESERCHGACPDGQTPPRSEQVSASETATCASSCAVSHGDASPRDAACRGAPSHAALPCDAHLSCASPRDASSDAAPPCDATFSGASPCETPPRQAPLRQTTSRHVPVEVRERLLERAGYRCEHCGPDGTRCTCRTGLQVDHTLPFAVYGTHDERFLRVLCPAHNLHAAREFYGSAFIQEKISDARSTSARQVAHPVLM